MVWLAVTRSPISRTRASSASTSRKRDCGSSVSSQCTSTRQPLRSARSMRNLIELTPWSRVFSKCGMPPTTSAPMAIASVISSRPPLNDSMPSCGKATICRSIRWRVSSRTSSMDLSADSVGSVTSTWVRTCWMPWSTSMSMVFFARALVSSWVTSALRSPQRSMPSNSVPLMFQAGSPAVRVASRWMCGSMKGGTTRLLAASMSPSLASAGACCALMAAMRAPSSSMR